MEQSFNADDRAAELNGSSYLRIPRKVRDQVNREFESFIVENIRAGQSFAFEATLRSQITFDQARAAKDAGFRIEMRYLALATFAAHLERVNPRGQGWSQRTRIRPSSDSRGEPRQSSSCNPRNGSHSGVRQQRLGGHADSPA